MNDDAPIYATVSPRARKKPGRKSNAELAALAAQATEEDAPEACPSCARPTSAMTYELMTELIRLARDRYSATKEPPTIDLLYVAARLDHYCSVRCWEMHTQPRFEGG